MRPASRSFLITAAALAGALAGLPACADHVSTAVQPCPCAAGYTCCGSGVCAANEDACGTATAALSSTVVGEWKGYVENRVFPSQSDDVRISLAVDDAGKLTGHVVLGTGTPPAPATDPDKAWPPDFHANQSIPDLYEGFAHTARDLTWEARRLKFWVKLNEPWKAWCELQTAYLRGDDGTYRCVPGTGSSPQPDGTCQTTGVVATVDCDKAYLCETGLACTCTASGCVEGEFGLTSSFDIALRGDTGDGSLDGTNLRLMRVSR